MFPETVSTVSAIQVHELDVNSAGKNLSDEYKNSAPDDTIAVTTDVVGYIHKSKEQSRHGSTSLPWGTTLIYAGS